MTAASIAPARLRGSQRRRPRREGSSLLFPIIAASLLLGIYPIGRGIAVGFTNERTGGAFGAAQTQFVGLDNFASVFGDRAFVSGLSKILVVALLVVAITYVLAYLQSLVLNADFPLRRVVRVIALLPLAVAPVIVGQTFGFLYDPSVGAANGWLVRLGVIDSGVFLPTSSWGVFWMALPPIWLALPFATLFLLAALQGVDQSVLEAATLDGAHAFQRFLAVQLPETTGALAAIVPLSFAAQLLSFDVFYAMLGGSLSSAAAADMLIPSIYSYYELSRGMLGRAAAVANVILLLAAVAFAASRLLDRTRNA